MVYHLVGAFNLSHNQHIMHMYEHRYRFFTLIVFRAGNALAVLRCKMMWIGDGKDPSLGLVGYKSP